MGFSNVTGKSRPKRPGCETKSERNKRKARQNDQETVEELRVVKAKRCGAKGGERAPEQLTKKKSQWEKKMAALLKTNDAIKALDARRAAGEDLDGQQLAKLARRDEVLLSLDALMEERPREAAAFVSAREAAAATALKRKAAEAQEAAAAAR